ncbi:MAG: hypothetical protein A3K19_00520 [Lentisphaerae bacterium RIFOXYB12_FULL_65_16]|nr:MAG: hypothetical protein A3K18_09905 [Lentisphaerae bacterium RIFOXYA12_64_32]OGV89919.1 MAG: hypothetical protein A3K19_00520 [Lentisphaerae bacterium RIFOXYB12_FULL_65_16]
MTFASFACFVVAVCLGCPAARAGGAQVPVGQYLYAKPANAEQFTGSLTVTFAKPGAKMVIAYGRKYRKDRRSREVTTEADRETFKPYQATVLDDGRKAVVEHLPADLYDLVVIQVKGMTVHEGLSMQLGADPAQATEALFSEVRETLSPRDDRIGGWDAFFDTKQFDRFESDGTRGAVFLQQLRRGKSLAESGAEIKGCIHSIDVCWMERAKVEGVDWQVITRQQLYRDEIESREFFRHKYVPELSGLRVGVKARAAGPIELP